MLGVCTRWLEMSHCFFFLAAESPNALRRRTFFRRAERGQDALTNSRFPPLVSITNNHFFLYLAVLTGRFSFASKLCSALIWAASRDQITSQATPSISSKEMGQIQSHKLAPTCRPLRQGSRRAARGEYDRGLGTDNGDFHGEIHGDLKLNPTVLSIVEVDEAVMLFLS